MAVSGSDYRVKRARENSDYFPFDCSKPKYKRRNVFARRDFPKGIVQFVSEPEELEAMESGNPVGFYQGSSVKSNHVVKDKSESKPEELGAVESGYDVLSEPINELPEKIVVARRKVYARRDFPEAFYANSSHFVKVDREESESEPEELEEIGSDHDPEAFYANSSHFVKVDREESESEPEELEAIDSDDDPEGFFASCSQFMKVDREAIDSDDNPKAFRANVDREETESDPEELEAIDSDHDLATTNPNHVAEVEKTEITCELEEIDGSSNAKPICSADKMEPEISKDTQNQEPVNQVVGSTEPLDSSSTQGAGEKRGDYIQHLLASLDQLAATLMQMKQQGAFKKKSAA
nr:transcription initiation factor TFIID subunit 11-like [Ipomoea batatas]